MRSARYVFAVALSFMLLSIRRIRLLEKSRAVVQRGDGS